MEAGPSCTGNSQEHHAPARCRELMATGHTSNVGPSERRQRRCRAPDARTRPLGDGLALQGVEGDPSLRACRSRTSSGASSRTAPGRGPSRSRQSRLCEGRAVSGVPLPHDGKRAPVREGDGGVHRHGPVLAEADGVVNERRAPLLRPAHARLTSSGCWYPHRRRGRYRRTSSWGFADSLISLSPHRHGLLPGGCPRTPARERGFPYYRATSMGMRSLRYQFWAPEPGLVSRVKASGPSKTTTAAPLHISVR